MASAILPLQNDTAGLPVNLEEVLAKQRGSPLSFEDFKNWLQKYHAEENAEFYERVHDFKQEATSSESATTVVENLAQEVSTEFIVPGSKKEINISGNLRLQIISEVNTAKPVRPTVFDGAAGEVKEMLKDTHFANFVKDALTKNLSEQEVFVRRVQTFIFAVLWLLALAVTFTLQLTLPGSIFDSRYWRLVSVPFAFAMVYLYFSSKRCLCMGFASQGVYLLPESRSANVLFRKKKMKQQVIESCARDSLMKEGRKLLREMIMYGTLVSVIVLLLPPGKDIYASW